MCESNAFMHSSVFQCWSIICRFIQIDCLQHNFQQQTTYVRSSLFVFHVKRKIHANFSRWIVISRLIAFYNFSLFSLHSECAWYIHVQTLCGASVSVNGSQTMSNLQFHKHFIIPYAWENSVKNWLLNFDKIDLEPKSKTKKNELRV